jgi:hypothetical protein
MISDNKEEYLNYLAEKLPQPDYTGEQPVLAEKVKIKEQEK